MYTLLSTTRETSVLTTVESRPWNDPFLFFFFDDDVFDDDDNVYYYICERLKLEGETEKMGVRSGRA